MFPFCSWRSRASAVRRNCAARSPTACPAFQSRGPCHAVRCIGRDAAAPLSDQRGSIASRPTQCPAHARRSDRLPARDIVPRGTRGPVERANGVDSHAARAGAGPRGSQLSAPIDRAKATALMEQARAGLVTTVVARETKPARWSACGSSAAWKATAIASRSGSPHRYERSGRDVVRRSARPRTSLYRVPGETAGNTRVLRPRCRRAAR